MGRGLDRFRWGVLSPYLDQALDLPSGERPAWLDALRAREPELALELGQLLRDYERAEAESFLAEVLPPRATLAGQALGAYTLREPIGHGGMGSVWRAERSDGRYDRLVAVKLLSASLIGHDAEDRFRREGRILARLRHPNIAGLVDAGVSPAGQPYLVLEHVDGEHIDAHCDQLRLGTAERLRLFLDVLAAVAHAHANLVVHRDLKPSNVLVDREGAVKLLDFGVAKLLAPSEGPAATTVTRDGGGALTPEYAAPEQLRGEDVTTATDVYALGALLYELLSGTHPLGAARRGSLGERIHAALEREPAPLSAASSSEAAPGLAWSRSTTPQALRRALAGDLEIIAAKALKKERAERYASVEALADDVRRHLHHAPIGVRPDSFLYSAGKFVRRNRRMVAFGTLAAIGLLAGVAGTVTQARRARAQAGLALDLKARADEEVRRTSAERDFALREQQRAEAIEALNFDVLSDAAPGDVPVTTSRLLERAERIVEREYGSVEDVKVGLLIHLGEIQVARNDSTRAVPLLGRAYDLARRSADPSLRARAACAIAESAWRSGDNQRGENLFAEGLAALPKAPQYAGRRAGCLMVGSALAMDRGARDDAVARAEEARDVLREAPRASPLIRFDASLYLASAYRASGRLRDAAVEMEAAWSRLESMGRERTLRAATLLNNWALVMNGLGRPLRGEALLRRAVAIMGGEGGQGPSAMMRANLAQMLWELGQYKEAVDLAESGYAEAVRLGDVRHRRECLMMRAQLYLSLRRPERAAAALDELEALLKQGEASPYWRSFQSLHLAGLALLREDRSAAIRLADRAVETGRAGSLNGARMSFLLLGRGEIGLSLGRVREAEADAREVLAQQGPPGGPDGVSCRRGAAELLLAQARRAQGDPIGARESAARAVRELAPTLGDGHAKTRLARALEVGTRPGS